MLAATSQFDDVAGLPAMVAAVLAVLALLVDHALTRWVCALFHDLLLVRWRDRGHWRAATPHLRGSRSVRQLHDARNDLTAPESSLPGHLDDACVDEPVRTQLESKATQPSFGTTLMCRCAVARMLLRTDALKAPAFVAAEGL
jgi:hypothetical protein